MCDHCRTRESWRTELDEDEVLPCEFIEDLDHDSCPAQAIDLITGRYVEDKSARGITSPPIACSGGMVSLIQDPMLRSGMGAAVRDKVRKDFWLPCHGDTPPVRFSGRLSRVDAPGGSPALGLSYWRAGPFALSMDIPSPRLLAPTPLIPWRLRTSAMVCHQA